LINERETADVIAELREALADCAHAATTAKTRGELHDEIWLIARSTLGPVPWAGSTATCLRTDRDGDPAWVGDP